jgi:hypothetical protein
LLPHRESTLTALRCNPFQPTGTWRNLVELSSMKNNDEAVFYSFSEQTNSSGGDFPEWMRKLSSRKHLTKPHLVFSRPVFVCEQDSGLKPEGGSLMDERIQSPAVTRFLDDLWKMQVYARFWLANGQTLDKIIINHIAYDYCDCMSGGMGLYAMSVARYLIQQLHIPDDVDVYPEYTVGRFMAETTHVPDFLSLFGKDVPKEAPLKLLGLGENRTDVK